MRLSSGQKIGYGLFGLVVLMGVSVFYLYPTMIWTRYCEQRSVEYHPASSIGSVSTGEYYSYGNKEYKTKREAIARCRSVNKEYDYWGTSL